ncbi:hypothetical protein C9374_009552 [Naegleria lovaniensis]|uniref:Vacuolar protein sorting-associated protein 54 n=1 Tax=Naegleria lovaniensis TaxID=51637 RepID=A0AA88GXT8_NAELO|nr:uncharacterized protein C9374_009552 [Naegleria lovaniensis]KAG2392975.1 hypothetical protein C9374_009552 [Naegleria lovaniensis]
MISSSDSTTNIDSTNSNADNDNTISTITTNIKKIQLVSGEERNEIQKQMDSLYEDIEVVSNSPNSTNSSSSSSIPIIGSNTSGELNSIATSSREQHSTRTRSPIGYDNYFEGHHHHTSSSSPPTIGSYSFNNGYNRVPSESHLGSSSNDHHVNGENLLKTRYNSEPNLKLDKEALDHLRFIQSMNFSQNFASIVNDPLEESSWIDAIGDYYWYGEKEKVIPSAKLPYIDLNDKEISSYLNKIEGLYKNFEKNKAKPTIPAQYYESELESANAMDIIINRELIPPIFFEEGFNLGDIATFQQIFSEEAMSASLLFQEKLSHYLDRTEVLLIHQVTFRSAKIFDAFVQYNQLDDDVKEALPLIKSLRSKIKEIDDIAAKSPLEITALVRKKNNMKKTLEVLKVVYAIQQSHLMIDELIGSNDFLSALDIINETRELVRTEFANVKCLRNIPERMQEKIVEIQSKAQNLFITKLIENYLFIFEPPASYNDAEYLSTFESDLRPIMKAMLIICDTQFIVQRYRDKLMPFINERITSTIDKTLDGMKITFSNASVSIAIDQNASRYLNSKTIQVLKSIPMDQFITVLSAIIDKSITFLKRSVEIVTIFHTLFENVEAMQKVKASNMLKEFDKINTSLNEQIHSRLSIIVSLRGDIVKSSTKSELLKFMEMCFNFIETAEKFVGKKVNLLRGSLQAVGQTFLDEFSKQHVETLKSILEKETWVWVENIQPKYQDIVNSIQNQDKTTEKVVATTNSASNNDSNASTETSAMKYITVKGELFPVCSSLLHLVKMTRNFLELLSVEHQKFVSSYDLSARICNLYGVFNVEVKNLILKAGAINPKSGLKTITAKHLALTSEVMGAVTLLLLEVKKYIENIEPSLKGKLLKFEDIATDLKEHRLALYQKVVDIMKDVLENHGKDFVKFDWDNGPRKDSPLNAIIKAMLSIHKVLTSYLQTHQNDLRKVFSRIATMCINRMKIGIQSLQNKVSRKAIKNIREDVSTVTKQLQKWSDVIYDDINLNEIENCFNECFVPASAVPNTSTPPQTQQTPVTTTSSNATTNSGSESATSSNK